MSSIQGIGCDIVSVSRIEKAFHNRESWKSVFTATEIAYFDQYQFPFGHIAGHFAAKEACAKALGTGFRKGLNFHDIEIQHDPLGKPIISLSEPLRSSYPLVELLVSISHEKEYATAYALAQKT